MGRERNQQQRYRESEYFHEPAVCCEIPLTPALSRRERGDCSPHVRQAGLLSPNGLSRILPLPAGEGRGEGPVHCPNGRRKGVESFHEFHSLSFFTVCPVVAGSPG